MKLLAMLSFFFLSAISGNAQQEVKCNPKHLSIAVSENSGSYSYKASFDKEHTEIVKDVIVKKLGKPTQDTDRYLVWENSRYDITLRKGKLVIEMDKASAKGDYEQKIKDLGDDVSAALGSPKTPVPPATH